MRKNPFTISNFLCPECGMMLPLPRLKGSKRGKGHIKDLYCPGCKKEQKFTEYRYRDFYKTMSGEILA